VPSTTTAADAGRAEKLRQLRRFKGRQATLLSTIGKETLGA
jgi:hypothetical protein